MYQRTADHYRICYPRHCSSRFRPLYAKSDRNGKRAVSSYFFKRRRNAFGLLMSLNMLIEFGDAFDYTAADFHAWCEEVGFRRFEVIELAGPSSAAVAYK